MKYSVWYLSPIIICGLIFTAACNKGSSDNSSATVATAVNPTPFNRSYELTDTTTNCTTGLQTFVSLDAFCQGLNNNTLNNNCAYARRQQMFVSTGCTGSWTATDTTSSLSAGLGISTTTVIPTIYYSEGYFDLSSWEWKGCSTGRHTFTTMDEYCKAVVDETLNNNCAKEQRTADYHANCLSEKYYYNITGSNCTTTQYFKTKAEMCTGLQNETLNNSCAKDLRTTYYNAYCK